MGWPVPFDVRWCSAAGADATRNTLRRLGFTHRCFDVSTIAVSTQRRTSNHRLRPPHRAAKAIRSGRPAQQTPGFAAISWRRGDGGDVRDPGGRERGWSAAGAYPGRRSTLRLRWSAREVSSAGDPPLDSGEILAGFSRSAFQVAAVGLQSNSQRVPEPQGSTRRSDLGLGSIPCVRRSPSTR